MAIRTRRTGPGEGIAAGPSPALSPRDCLMSLPRRGLWSRPVVAGFLLVLAGSPPALRAQDSWDAVYLSGQKVGHIHTFVAPVKDKGKDLVRVRVDMVLSFKRLQ